MGHNFQEWNLSQQFPPYASFSEKKPLKTQTAKNKNLNFLRKKEEKEFAKCETWKKIKPRQTIFWITLRQNQHLQIVWTYITLKSHSDFVFLTKLTNWDNINSWMISLRYQSLHQRAWNLALYYFGASAAPLYPEGRYLYLYLNLYLYLYLYVYK